MGNIPAQTPSASQCQDLSYTTKLPLSSLISSRSGLLVPYASPFVTIAGSHFPALGSRLMSIKEVAKRARVSTATVSRTLNDSADVRPETAARVRKAIEELKYYPNTHARTLVSGRSRMFGLIISDITNPFFPDLVKGFEDAAVQRGQEVIIGNTNYNPKRMAHCIRRMLERKVDGVAIMTSETDPDLFAELVKRKVPTVLLDTGTAGDASAVIHIDYAHGIGEAVEHLLALRHRRIAFIAGPMKLPSAQIRQEAFVAGIESHGMKLDPALLQSSDHKIEGGAAAMTRLLKLADRPTAVMTSNDLSAIGALGAIYEAGLRVPEDISLVGFDDISFAHLTQPPLTTVRVSRARLAETAFHALEGLVQHNLMQHNLAQRNLSQQNAGSPDAPQLDYSITTHLVIRNSTRAL